MRIVHLSDPHFPIPDPARRAAIKAAVVEAKADLVLITGDLTRAGRRSEFAAARAFTDELPKPLFVIAGNHDVPVFNPAARVLRPFSRFAHFFPGEAAIPLGGDRYFLARLDTARGVTRSFDWSLGEVTAGALSRVTAGLSLAPARALRMVACHHPLVPDAADSYRSRTRRGPAALERLAHHKVAIVFHGHLHRSSTRFLPAGAGKILSVGAGTLSERERGAGASFNLVTVEGSRVLVTEMLWSRGSFIPARIFAHTIDRTSTTA